MCNLLFQGRLVLLAEDNLINQRVAKMMLASLGMTVEVVSNGQEAVEAAKRRIGREGVRQFDVLLMDMAMPVMGGVDATKVCRLFAPHKSQPLVSLSRLDHVLGHVCGYARYRRCRCLKGM